MILEKVSRDEKRSACKGKVSGECLHGDREILCKWELDESKGRRIAGHHIAIVKGTRGPRVLVTHETLFRRNISNMTGRGPTRLTVPSGRPRTAAYPKVVLSRNCKVYETQSKGRSLPVDQQSRKPLSMMDSHQKSILRTNVLSWPSSILTTPMEASGSSFFMSALTVREETIPVSETLPLGFIWNGMGERCESRQ